MQITAISPFNRKVITVATIIYAVVAMSDVLINMLVWLFHSLIELLHTLFETVEMILDRSVEHLFHTGLHETQVIVFYVMLGVVVWACYKLWHGLPHWYKQLIGAIKEFLSDQKYAAFYDWKTQSLRQKICSIILLALCVAALYYFFL